MQLWVLLIPQKMNGDTRQNCQFQAEFSYQAGTRKKGQMIC